jgi:signal transduction histidine kinase
MRIRFRGIFHPVTFFIVAQISWCLLMFLWIRWYVMRSQEIDVFVDRFSLEKTFGAGQWVILAEGCVLMTVLLIALYIVFVHLRKQIQVNRLQDAILSSVTHELKTPLASIRLNTETMLLRELNLESRNLFLKRTLSEAERLQKLIDSVLISARFEALPALIEAEETNLVSLAEQAFQKVLDRYGQARTFKLVTADKPFFMVSNRQQITILFDNLLDNAVKYSDDSGIVTLEIHVNRVFRAKVSDTGLGIEKEYLNKIFRKFYRVASNAKLRVDGSGLGLFVCKSIVKAHAGSIHATSEGKNKGATFHVEFSRTAIARRR